MSNFLFLKIKMDTNVSLSYLSQLNNAMNYARTNAFYIRLDNIEQNATNAFFTYTISDCPGIDYCESFLQPIIYDNKDTPLTDELCCDLILIKDLVKKIYSCSFVKCVELYFSDVEVDECEYKKCTTNVAKMDWDILNEYLKTTVFPTIKMIIER